MSHQGAHISKMLSIFLTQKLEQEHKNCVIYYFCNSTGDQSSHSTAVLRGLIWQIANKRPGLVRSILQYFNPPERTQAVLSTPGTLWGILVLLTGQAESAPMYCLIDGLDECDDESTRWLALKLASMTMEADRGHLHLSVVSRDVSELRHVNTVQLDSGEKDNYDDNINHDIASFTSTRMAEISRRLNLNEELSSQIQSELPKKAEGTFL